MSEEIRNNEQEQEEKVEKAEKIDLGASLRKEHKEKKPVNRKVAVLVALLVIVAVAALAIVLPKVLTPKVTDDTPVVEDLSVALVNYESDDDVVSVKVESDDSSFTVTRTGKGDEAIYHVSGMDDALVNQGTCESVFIQASILTADQLVEENATDLAQYGLDDPQSVLTVEYADGNKLVLEIGDMLSVTGQVYARKAGETDVYALRKYLYQIYGGSIQRYRDLTLPTLSTDISQTKSIIVRQPGQEQIRFLPDQQTNSASTTWMMTEPVELPLDSGYLAELVEAVANVQLYDYHGKYEELAQFGLEEPWMEIIVSDTVGGKRVFRFGDHDEERSIYYCTVDDSGDVFTVYDTYTDAFTGFSVAYYLDRFTNIVAIGDVEKMEVTDGSKTYVLSIEREEQYEEDGSLKVLGNGKTDYLETFFIDGKEYQESAFKAGYQSIISVTISNMADMALVDETQTPVLTVTYHFNNGQEPMEIAYLPYDINNYCVRRDGKINLICKRELVDSIMPTMQDVVNGVYDEEE